MLVLREVLVGKLDKVLHSLGCNSVFLIILNQLLRTHHLASLINCALAARNGCDGPVSFQVYL